jgi:hypothetical protein
MVFEDLEYYSESEISTEFIPGGNIMDFVPGGGDAESGVPGKNIENGTYVGLVRMWAGDRRMDWKLRVKDNELEEKRDFYFKGEQFFSRDWDSSWGSWDWGIVTLPEGATHTLKSFIELHLEQASYDEINEIWWEAYEDHY